MRLNNVPLFEAHILTSRKGKVRVFDGKGRYHYFPHFQKRVIMPKTIIEIKSPRIKHHDVDKLPFGVELACKIQITDPEQAAMTLGNSSSQEIRNYVEETIISAMRSQAMQRNLLDIMRNRDELEGNIYRSTHDALAKIGIEVLMFDIINIVDVDDSHVIHDLERVKSAELSRHARESEAIHQSKATIIESQQQSDAEVARQEAFRKQETARIQQEITVAEQRQELMEKEMGVKRIERERSAEIQRQQLLIQVQTEADRKKRLAQADAEAILIKSKAEAEAIRMKMEAEAEGTEKLAEALEKLDEAGLQVKLREIHSHMTIESAKALAEGIRNNTKLFLPISSGNGQTDGNMTSVLTSLLPGLTVLDEYRSITNRHQQRDKKSSDQSSKKEAADA
jgi:flotillin